MEAISASNFGMKRNHDLSMDRPRYGMINKRDVEAALTSPFQHLRPLFSS